MVPSAVGVAGQENETTADPMAPVFVTGAVGEMAGTVWTHPRKETVWTGEIRCDDPRLDGTLSYSENEVWFKRDVNISVHARVWELAPAPDGPWLGTATMFGTITGPVYLDEETVVLVGQGPLEGLSAYLMVDWTQDPVVFQGAIFPGEMPEFPEGCPWSRHHGQGDRPCPS